jgi:tetratricopeptide (TPR) repeat protein
MGIGEQVEVARKYLRAEKPEGAIEILNDVLRQEVPRASQTGDRSREAEARLALAAALEMGQRQRHISMPENHLAIVEQTRTAEKAGGKLVADDYRRLGDSLVARRPGGEGVGAYRKAMDLDGKLLPALGRRVVELLLAKGEKEEAEKELEKYLGGKLSEGERAWALGEKAGLLLERREFAEAKGLLGEVEKLLAGEVGEGVDSPEMKRLRGESAYRLGWCMLELGDEKEAERQLRLARQLMTVSNPLDAEAALRLGKIYENRGKADEARAYYENIIQSHPDSRSLVTARLGRGVTRLMKGEDDAGLTDLEWAAGQVGPEGKAEVRRRDTKAVLEGLEKGEGLLADRQNYQGALEVLGMERQLIEPTDGTIAGGTRMAAFWGRVAAVYEKRADQVESAAKRVEGGGDEKQQLMSAVRQLRVKAGDAAFAHAMSLTMTDNDGYGLQLWHAMELYDRGGAVQSVIAALTLFTQERPSDPLAPEAMLRLGKAYMAAGLFDKAIETFQRNQFRYPRSWAASQSAVPLAQSLIAKGAAGYGRAETVLLAVVDNNPALTPQASEFRNALFELAQLYYREGRFEDAIARFDEVMKRYPGEERIGQVLFLMADAYRKSAGLLVGSDGEKKGGGEAVKASEKKKAGDDGESEAEVARRQRLIAAKQLFERVIAYQRDHPPVKEIERSQQRLAHFYRADCAFDLGLYEDAIKLYDQAAFRYQDDPSALAAYVQIVNANVALGRPAEARSANERAKWLLKRMPPSAFSDGSFALSRAYWERWLKWSGEEGVAGR